MIIHYIQCIYVYNYRMCVKFMRLGIYWSVLIAFPIIIAATCVVRYLIEKQMIYCTKVLYNIVYCYILLYIVYCYILYIVLYCILLYIVYCYTLYIVIYCILLYNVYCYTTLYIVIYCILLYTVYCYATLYIVMHRNTVVSQ